MATSKKSAGKILDQLGEKCSSYVCHEFKNELEKVFSESLPKSLDWKIDVAKDDPDMQTLIFEYPTVLNKENENYIRQEIRIEFGARSDHWPVEIATVRPMISETIKGTISSADTKVKVLVARRTFWEKATILHLYAYYPSDKTVPARQSRHYYDFYKMLASPVREEATAKLDLLQRVAEHKDIYFRAKWPRYDLAKKGTLKLIPSQDILTAMRRDYQSMETMFYGDVPTWIDIIEAIREFEKQFNES